MGHSLSILSGVKLLRGDTLVWDRWIWLKKYLPKTGKKPKLLDVGCGLGVFSILSAKRGYSVLGLNWDEYEKEKAERLAKNLGISNCFFEVQDARKLDERKNLFNKFDVVICAEVIEHIINDKQLMKDIYSCLLPGGVLLLTSPNYNYAPISQEESGPFEQIEDGRHVRKGYTPETLKILCNQAGLKIEKIGFCGGFLSQKITKIYRKVGKINTKLAWLAILPLRPFAILLDKSATKALKWPFFSICMMASKPLKNK